MPLYDLTTKKSNVSQLLKKKNEILSRIPKITMLEQTLGEIEEDSKDGELEEFTKGIEKSSNMAQT